MSNDTDPKSDVRSELYEKALAKPLTIITVHEALARGSSSYNGHQ